MSSTYRLALKVREGHRTGLVQVRFARATRQPLYRTAALATSSRRHTLTTRKQDAACSQSFFSLGVGAVRLAKEVLGDDRCERDGGREANGRGRLVDRVREAHRASRLGVATHLSGARTHAEGEEYRIPSEARVRDKFWENILGRWSCAKREGDGRGEMEFG